MDFDFDDFGGIDPGFETGPDGRPPGFMSGSERGSRFETGAGDGSGRDAGIWAVPVRPPLAGGGWRCVAGALLPETGAGTVSSTSAFPHDVQETVPSAANDSQRPQTMPITGSIDRRELIKSQYRMVLRRDESR
jgi:hypothetical protein